LRFPLPREGRGESVARPALRNLEVATRHSRRCEWRSSMSDESRGTDWPRRRTSHGSAWYFPPTAWRTLLSLIVPALATDGQRGERPRRCLAEGQGQERSSRRTRLRGRERTNPPLSDFPPAGISKGSVSRPELLAEVGRKNGEPVP